MIKKIAMVAFAVSAVLSNAFAADPQCSVILGTSSCTFRGTQWTPEVKRVRCGTDDFTEFKSVKYGQNINAGVDAGTVTIELKDGTVINHKFEILQKEVGLKILDYEKELGAENPEFEYEIEDEDNLNSLEADTLANFKKTLKSTLKMAVADGVEKVGDVFDITLDESLELDKLFPNYMIQVQPGTLTITKTKITVTAKDASKAYGEADPKKFEYTITGNIKASDYDKLGKITLTRADGEDAGEYEIAVSVDQPADDHGYIVSTVPAKFTITPIAVSLTIDDMTKGYGNATKEFTYKATGLVGQDELKDVTLVCANCASDNLENVGEYEITASIKEGSNPNYTITTTPGKLTVTPKDVTVTVKDAEKVYGEKDPTFTFETEGLVGENEKLEKATIARADGEDVGTYKVSVDFETGSNPNYTVTVKEGTLTVTPKDVTLTADDVSKKFGEQDPEFTYKVEGLVSFAGVEDKLSGVKLTRKSGEDAGTYAITATVDAKANPNYVVTVADGGSLTIIANDDKIVVSIKGHTKTVTYDGKKQTVTGYDISTSSKAYDLKFVEFTGDSTVSGTDAATYAMGLDKTNFKNTSVNYPKVEFEVTDGSLEITPKSIIVTAVADSITYGDATPTEFKWTADSLLTGDALDNIHVGISKTGRLAAGEYDLEFDKKNPTNKNYVVTKYVPAKFKVARKNATVTIADTSKVYGQPDPENYRVTIDGMLEGDNLGTYTVAREAGENVRPEKPYSISLAFASNDPNPNYNVKTTQGKFTITPYTDEIKVTIQGLKVCKVYTGEEITVPVSEGYDFFILYFGSNPLPEELAYKPEYVSYTNATTTITKTNKYVYPMNLDFNDFTNNSPNFTNIVFTDLVSGSASLVIKDDCEEHPTKLAVAKAATKFGLSSAGRRIQVSGSTVGSDFAILDMQGKVVRTGIVNSSNFEVTVPNAGIYMVRMGRYSQRIRVK